MNNTMKHFVNTEGIPEETYYHYTSLDVLYSIVTRKSFRLTSLKSSNDKKEMYYNPKKFLIDFSKVRDIEQNADISKYFEFIDRSIKKNEEDFLKQCRVRAYPYALCLSEKKDNLTHWDRYASGCSGVCIGFNVSSLKAMCQRMASTHFGVGLYDVGKVYYFSHQREEVIKHSIMRLINTFAEKEGQDGYNVVEMVRRSGYLLAATACMYLTKFFKNSSFVDEDEIRLYHDSASIQSTLQIIDSMKQSLEPELYKNLRKHFLELVEQLHLEEEKFCMTKNGIRSYRELYLEKVWGPGTIPEIILGPLCIQNRNELSRFLKANGLLGTKVSVSKVPIR